MYIYFIFGISFLFKFFFFILNKIFDWYLFSPIIVEEQKYLKLDYETDDIKSEFIKLNQGGNNFIAINKIIPKTKFSKYFIFSHGNKATIYRTNNYLVKMALELNVGIFTYDYSGYGLSSGKCSEKKCYENLSNLINYILSLKINKKNLILVGRSLGTGITIDFVSKQKNWMNPIILISPYKSILHVAFDKIIYNCKYLKFLKQSNLPFDRFKTMNKIKNLNCPIKFVHGSQDFYIPLSHSKELYEHTRNKLFGIYFVENANHTNIMILIDFKQLKEVVDYN